MSLPPAAPENFSDFLFGIIHWLNININIDVVSQTEENINYINETQTLILSSFNNTILYSETVGSEYIFYFLVL